MDDYFIREIDWGRCTDPINAIDFSASLEALEEMAAVLEMLGLVLYEPIAETFYNNTEDGYFTLDVAKTHVEVMTCKERIAPLPTQYLNALLPALILAHLDDPASVKQVYNDFFENKKEEITPLLDN